VDGSITEIEMNSNVRLSEIKEGAVEEMYQRALKQVLENVEDPNTDAKTERTILIKLKLKPTPDRSILMVDVQVNSKIAASNPVQTSFLVKTERGRLFAHEPIQEQMFKDKSAN
jgi:hypothetical protein